MRRMFGREVRIRVPGIVAGFSFSLRFRWRRMSHDSRPLNVQHSFVDC